MGNFLEKILTDVRDKSIGVEDARDQIRALFLSMLEKSAVGISNVDATEMYLEMIEHIEKS